MVCNETIVTVFADDTYILGTRKQELCKVATWQEHELTPNADENKLFDANS